MDVHVYTVAETQRPVKLGTFRDGRYLEHNEWSGTPLRVRAKIRPYLNVSRGVIRRQKGCLINNFAIEQVICV